MKSETFSFVIPAYNDAKGIERHFAWFFARKESIQLIIIDDASDDNTGEVVKQASPPTNVRIDYRRQPVNSGPGAARNAGIDLAIGDFLMFLDADDLLADCFFTYINLSALRNGADLVLFKYHLALESSKRYTYEMHRGDASFFSRISNSGFPMRTFTLKDIPSALNTINFPWNKIYRTDFFRAAGISFPELRMQEDILPHWHSFLRSGNFGILAWAPPLITHYETDGGGRATNYVGELRMAVFPLLRDLYQEMQESDRADFVIPEFIGFCDGLFHWMTEVLCSNPTAETQVWRTRYSAEISEFRQFLNAA